LELAEDILDDETEDWTARSPPKTTILTTLAVTPWRVQ
jgi:hypothetical protein